MLLYHKTVIYVGTIIIFISFLFAFLNRRSSAIPSYLRHFYLYPLFVLLVSANTIAGFLIDSYPSDIGIFMEKILTVIDFAFWTFFFYSVNTIIAPRLKKLVLIIFLLTLLPTLVINTYERFTYVSLSVFNFSKCLFCLLYFSNLFKMLQTVSLKKDPVFWIVLGLFFYTAVTIPIYVTTTYLHQKISNSLLLFPLTNIAIIIMHLLFIKGHLCVINRKAMQLL